MGFSKGGRTLGDHVHNIFTILSRNWNRKVFMILTSMLFNSSLLMKLLQCTGYKRTSYSEAFLENFLM